MIIYTNKQIYCACDFLTGPDILYIKFDLIHLFDPNQIKN